MKSRFLVTIFLIMMLVGITNTSITFAPQNLKLAFAEESQFETHGLCPLECDSEESASIFLTGLESESQFETHGLCPLECDNEESASIFLT